MAAGSNNFLPMIWGFLFFTTKYETSYEAKSAFVKIVNAVHIKFVYTSFKKL